MFRIIMEKDQKTNRNTVNKLELNCDMCLYIKVDAPTIVVVAVVDSQCLYVCQRERYMNAKEGET